MAIYEILILNNQAVSVARPHDLAWARYIEGNPVRARMAVSARDWKWSSHLETSDSERRELIDELPISLPANWTKYVDEPITDKEPERVRQSVDRQSPLGVLEWVIGICKRLGLGKYDQEEREAKEG